MSSIATKPKAQAKPSPKVQAKVQRKAPGEYTQQELENHYTQALARGAVYKLGLLNARQDPVSRHARFIRNDLDTVLQTAYLGFDTPLPNFIEGCKVLFIGSGNGRDAFVAAKLAGSKGSVLALDPYKTNIKTANALVEAQSQKFGFAQANIEFKQCLPEDLPKLALAGESFDIIITNYTFNLVTNQEGLIREAYRLLRFGGEIYLSALFSNRRVTPNLLKGNKLNNPLLQGAIYLEDFRRWLRGAGWENFRYMEKRRVVIENPQEKKAMANYDLVFRIIRAFKLDNLEDLCENYGQSVEYLGTIPGYNQFFDLDDYHRFFIDKPVRVCGNTCALLENTRFAPYFRIKGNRKNKHFGLYDYCPYCVPGIKEDNIIEYMEDGKEVCGDCSHRAFCVVDGHCQHGD